MLIINELGSNPFDVILAKFRNPLKFDAIAIYWI